MLVCVCCHVFANYTFQWGMEKVSNLAFSIKTLHLKVMTLFHLLLGVCGVQIKASLLGKVRASSRQQDDFHP